MRLNIIRRRNTLPAIPIRFLTNKLSSQNIYCFTDFGIVDDNTKIYDGLLIGVINKNDNHYMIAMPKGWGKLKKKVIVRRIAFDILLNGSVKLFIDQFKSDECIELEEILNNLSIVYLSDIYEIYRVCHAQEPYYIFKELFDEKELNLIELAPKDFEMIKTDMDNRIAVTTFRR